MVSPMPKFVRELTALSSGKYVGDAFSSSRHVAVEVIVVVVVVVVVVTVEIGIVRLTTFTFRRPFLLRFPAIAATELCDGHGSCSW